MVKVHIVVFSRIVTRRIQCDFPYLVKINDFPTLFKYPPLDYAKMAHKSLVRPNNLSLGEADELSPLDQYMIRIIIPVMCIFQIDSKELRPTIVANLKAGLARTIDEMPFIACVIVPDDQERGTMKLIFDGEETGIWFYEQELPEYDYESLAKRRFSFADFPITDFVPEPRGHSEKSPVITVLVTFIKGGLVMTFNGHHAVMDAQSLGTFVTVWSRNVLSVSEGLTVPPKERFNAEDLDRTGMSSAFSARPLQDYPTYQPGAECLFGDRRDEIIHLSVSGDHSKLKEMVPISHWVMSQAAVETLNRSVSEAFPKEPGVTEAALISALIWRNISIARGLLSKGASGSALFTSMNVRRMLDPQLAMTYPGNAIALARADASSKELNSDKELRTLYLLARRISDSIEWWTPEQLWDLAGTIHESQNVENLMLPNLDNSFYISQPARFGDLLGKSQWGTEMGAIKSIRFAFAPPVDGFACSLPALTGGLDLMIWIDPMVQARLKTTKEWTKWVEEVK